MWCLCTFFAVRLFLNSHSLYTLPFFMINSKLVAAIIMEDMKRSRKRTAHPLLLLLQRVSYRARKSELLRQNSKDGDCSPSSTDGSRNKQKEAHSGAHQDCCKLSPGVEASYEPFWLESRSLSVSEKSASWIGKVTNLCRMSSHLSAQKVHIK